MAPTFRSAKTAFISLTSSTGGVINMSSGVNDSGLERTVASLDTTTYGDSDNTYLAGLRDAKIPVSGLFSSTHANKLDPLLGSTALSSWVWAPFGTASGSKKYTGSAIITDLAYSAPVDDKVTAKFTLQCSGAITSTAY